MKKLVQCFPPPVLKFAVVPVLIAVSECSCSCGDALVATGFGRIEFGSSETAITSVDPDGVALAAIQGLNQKENSDVAALRVELRQKEKEITELKRRLDTLEKIILSRISN